MKKNKLKRISFILLAVIIMAVQLLGISESGIQNAYALDNTDNFKSLYGITYEDLFDLCPQYLDNDKFEVILVENYANAAAEALADAQEREDTAKLFHYLSEGISYPIDYILGEIGITETEYEKYQKDVAMSVLKDFYATEYASSTVYKSANSNLKNIKKVYDVTYDVATLAKDIVDNYAYYDSVPVVEEIIKAICDSKVIKPYLSDGTMLFNIVVEVITLHEIESQSIDLILEALEEYPDTELEKALVTLKTEIERDPATYILQKYITDKLIGKLVKIIKELAVESVIGGAATTLISLSKKAIEFIYELNNPSYEDIQKSYISYNYYVEACSGVNAYKKKFKKNNYNDRDIILYETMYSLMLSTLRITAEISQKCAFDDNMAKYRLESFTESIGELVTYEKYIEFCMCKVKEDIDAGVLVIKDNAATTPADKENYSSVESIKSKFMAIQNQYKPNSGQAWYGNWGGAIQCFGFARMVFSYLYGCEMPYSYDSYERYRYRTEDNVTLIAQVTGTNVNKDSVKATLSQGKLGDIIQASGSLYGQHTMVFVSADDSGVTVYDCNAVLSSGEGSCLIHQWTISWDIWVKNYGTGNSSIANGISLYRADNYSQIYGDGDGMFYDDSVNFVIENGVLTKYNGWQRYVSIPDTVTAIGDSAFINNTTIMTVEIPDSVKSIGNSAFYGCTNLIAALMPDSVERVGSSAFYNCISMNTLVLPVNENFSKISLSAFNNCQALRGVEIPDSVTEIGDSVFSGCTALKNVTLSKSLETIGQRAFYNCDGLTKIEIPKSIKDGCGTWRSSQGPFSNCSNLKNIYFEEGTARIAKYLFADCDGIESIEIPDTVTTIEIDAFYQCSNLAEVTIPDSVTEIGDSAFSGCTKLETITIPDSVTKIWSYAFSGCTALKNVVLSKSLETIGQSAFYNCDGLTKIEIPKSVKYGGDSSFSSMGAFNNCSNLKNIYFEGGTTRIAKYLFANCDGIESIVIPDTVTTIESCAFHQCSNLAEVTIVDSVTKIGDSAFSGCTKLETITIPDSVTEIGSSAFSNCTALNNVTLSKSLETIGQSAFYNCDGLTKIEIPKSVKYGGYSSFSSMGAFNNCSNLKKIYFEEGTTRIAQYLFAYCDGIESIEIPDTVTTIESCAFHQCSNLAEATIVDSVTKIGGNAFSGCTKLETITIPDSVTTIGSYAFSDCSALTKVSLSDNITIINESLFSNCKKLSELKLPKKLNKVENRAFYNCDGLTELEFPYGTTYVGSNVLQDAGSLTKVIIPNTVTYLGTGAFYDCTSLKEVVWGSGITDIKSQTFYGCTVLPKITIPETVTKIGSEVFKNCVKLYEVSIPESVTSIPLDAFSYPKKTTIYGYKNSYAENYASEKGINFVAVEKKEENISNEVTVEHDIFETPDNTSLIAEKISESDTEYQSIAATLAEKNITTAYEAYNIRLIDANNCQLQPTGELQIKILLPAGYQIAMAKVYRVEDDGTFTDMSATYEEGNLAFTTKYLATYLVAEGELKEKADYIYGDANSDGVVNSKDVVMMKKHLAGYTVDINLAACDVNGDDAVNSKDVVLVMKRLAGYDVVLGK